MWGIFIKARCMHAGDHCRMDQESETKRERERGADSCLKDLQASV